MIVFLIMQRICADSTDERAHAFAGSTV